MAEMFVLEEASSSSDDSGAWKPIEDGTILEARVKSVKRVVKPFKDDNGNPVERVEFAFEVTQTGDFEGRIVRGETSTSFADHERCKMRNWVQEILGMDLPVGFRFNTDAIVDSSCKIRVSKKVKPRRDGNGDWVENAVADVMRVSAQTSFSDEEPF